MIDNRLARLLESARHVEMSADQREEQRRSFAFGNASIGNEHVTRETVNRAAAELEAERSREGN